LPEYKDQSPDVQSSAPTFGVVIVNWNNAAETMACIKTLDEASPPPSHVVVVDNGSLDDSVARLEAWADENWMWRVAQDEGIPWLGSSSRELERIVDLQGERTSAFVIWSNERVSRTFFF
jgi:glycosyltransferase involved in cell wall biosynthesis